MYNDDTMSEDQFTRQFTYMSGRFDTIEAKLEEKADKKYMNRVFGLLDQIVKRQEIEDDERLVMGYQLDRLNRWTRELAKKIGHKLSV